MLAFKFFECIYDYFQVTFNTFYYNYVFVVCSCLLSVKYFASHDDKKKIDLLTTKFMKSQFTIQFVNIIKV